MIPVSNTEKTTQFNQVDSIIAFEQGELDQEQVVELFQYLINTGLVWQLQGFYGRTARDLIENGLCTLPAKKGVQS